MMEPTTHNIKIGLLLKQKEAIERDIRGFEFNRTTILSEISVYENMDPSSTKTSEDQVKLNMFIKMKSTLVNLKILGLDEKIKKCRYHNRGYCKLKGNCNFFHSTSICQQFLDDRECQKKGCIERHPRDCRFW